MRGRYHGTKGLTERDKRGSVQVLSGLSSIRPSGRSRLKRTTNRLAPPPGMVRLVGSVPGARPVVVTHSNAGHTGRRRWCLTKIVQKFVCCSAPGVTHSGIKESNNCNLRRKMPAQDVIFCHKSSAFRPPQFHQSVLPVPRCAAIQRHGSGNKKRRPRNAAS